MRNIAVVAFSQTHSVRCQSNKTDAEMLAPIIEDVFEKSGIPRKQIGFIVSGSTDYLSGVPFSFTYALDAAAPWPPISESHVEMDGAWALFDAWVRLQCGDIDSALIYSFGKSSTPNDLVDVLTLQMDPYTVAPLGIDSISLAGLQGQQILNEGLFDEKDFAQVAIENRFRAKKNPYAQLKGDYDLSSVLAEPYISTPLRKSDCSPISDGACAMIIAAEDLARNVCERPVWIGGIDHRIEAHQIGFRHLVSSPSTVLAAQTVGAHRDKIEVAEIHAPFSFQELIIRHALGIDDSTQVNPSGGALAANPIMSTGLIRVGEVARRIAKGEVDRGIAHATSGSCLQQNLVVVLEGS